MARSLIVEEEESLIFHDRASRAIRQTGRRLNRELLAGYGIGRRLGKRIACFESIAAAVHEDVAMEGIGSRTGLCGDEACDCPSEFSREILGIDAGFADRIHRGVDDDDAVDRLAIVCSVKLVTQRTVVRSIDVECLSALGIFRGMDVEGSALNAGNQERKRTEIAVQIGQILKLALRDRRTDSGIIHLERGSRSGYGHGSEAPAG